MASRDVLRLDRRAGNGTRTRDPNLGKVVLYQLSYSRVRRASPGQSLAICQYSIATGGSVTEQLPPTTIPEFTSTLANDCLRFR